ncbi:MAG: 4Fe-4S dicluster domain-containing protein [Actinobacteria bacterium]|jgi:molybdopterin-containing oxidoreductase family iron-sulfur binding subunit|nr:4Fe-4S dicluster domain-containing protein [Actinomycetota bacterium]
MRYGMAIDLKKCVGCNACTVACRMENGTPPGILLCQVEKYEVGTYPAARMDFLPRACMHCAEPPCLEVCPTGATYQREDGLVLVDPRKCMGCRYCVLACPYEARHPLRRIENYYGPGTVTPWEEKKHKTLTKGTVQKCTFCAHRLGDGRQPACVEVCPANARCFGDLDDPESDVSRVVARQGGSVLKAELGTCPSVYYLNS